MEREKEIIHKELSYALGGLFYRTHDVLGRYALEKQYGNLFERLLRERKIGYEREKFITRTGSDMNRADFVIQNLIVVEFKTKPIITRDDYYQVQRYLEYTNLRLGLLVNFRQEYLKPKRILNTKYNPLQ